MSVQLTRDALKRPCPVCEALPGQPCKGLMSGKPLQTATRVHSTRFPPMDHPTDPLPALTPDVIFNGGPIGSTSNAGGDVSRSHPAEILDVAERLRSVSETLQATRHKHAVFDFHNLGSDIDRLLHFSGFAPARDVR